MRALKKIPVLAGCTAALSLLGAVIFILFFWQNDISANRTGDQLVFGATYMTMNNPYYQVLDAHLRAEIETRGDILLTRDATMDQGRQNQEILDLIAAGVKAIFLTPVEWGAVKPGLEAAARAGVPVIVVDAPVLDAELVTCSVLSDNYQAGVLCAEHLLSVRDSAKIILLEHITAVSGVQRIRGFLDTIEGHEGFEILASGESDGQIENAMPVMEELLAQAPQADTVMALNDPSALGALAAIQGSGVAVDRFLVYAVDGSPEGKGMVSDGLMTATCAQFPYKIAETAAEQGYLAIEGKCEQKEITIPVELLTAETVDRYGTDGWQ